MKKVSYEVGMLVDHPNKPEWEPGKIVHVEATKVYVFFRDALERKARPIVFTVAPLQVAASQSDAVLDQLPIPSKDAGSWLLPASYKQEALPDQPPKPMTKAKGNKPKTKAKGKTTGSGGG